MKIRLDEISAEGKDYSFDENSKELTGALADLKLDRFQMDVKIKPLDSYFQLTGAIRGQAKEVCGQCGFDIDLDVANQMNDMILPRPMNPRGSQYSKNYSASESPATEVVYHEGGVFDLGEYLHEAVLLGMPDYPTCEKNGCPRVQETKERLERINRESEKFGGKKAEGAFDALKNLKFH